MWRPTPFINLYRITLDLIYQGLHASPTVLDMGEEHGTVDIAVADGVTTFIYQKYDRTFVLGLDKVLVERVTVKPQVEAPKIDPKTPQQYLHHFAKHGDIPEKPGETVTIRYGEYEGKLCVLIGVRQGVVADFRDEGIKLFYDIKHRVVRRYADQQESEKRLAALEREKLQRRTIKYMLDPVEQVDQDGEIEVVDRVEYPNVITCECGRVRYVKNADMHQVKKCKMCQYRWKKKRKKGRKATWTKSC